MTQEKKGVLYFPEFTHLVGGDVITALMLSQIFYWYRPDDKGKSKLRVYRGGKWWIAKSMKEWQEELGISLKQARRSVEVLQEHGLIETAVMRFNGSAVVHLRFSRVLGRGMLKDPNEVITIGIDPAPLCPTGHPALPSGASSNALQGNPITESTAESTTHTFYASANADAQQENSMKAAEVLKKFEEKKTDKVKGDGVSAMAMLWKKRMSLHQQWVKNLLPKEVGQLKHVHIALGTNAVAVLDWALQNWQVFAHEVQVSKGVMPAMAPHVGFFCQHWEIALALSSKKETVDVQPVAAAPTFSIKPVHNAVHDEPTATADEVQATLEALAALAAGKKPVG